MKTFFRILKWTSITLFTILIVFLSWFYLRYGGTGRPFPDMSTHSRWPADSLHLVASLPEPPGNIAVSRSGRIFFTYHAESHPEIKVMELVEGKPVPFPNQTWQSKSNGKVYLDAIFNIRIDARDRLWTLDHGQNGFKTPRLLCFDINTRQLVDQIDLPRAAAGIGSYVQDMQIDTACRKIYIADLSAFGKAPAVLVVDMATKKVRRLLGGHPSVQAEGSYRVVNKGREMRPVGPLYFFHPGIDPIALDRKNEYLYYGPMSGTKMYRIRTADLNNERLSARDLEKRVEVYASRGQCDGITMDDQNDIYLTDMENGAISVIDQQRRYFTLVSHPKMRWPDGLSFGPDDYVYVSDSDIPDVMMRSKSHIHGAAPFFIWKFKGLAPAAAGQ